MRVTFHTLLSAPWVSRFKPPWRFKEDDLPLLAEGVSEVSFSPSITEQQTAALQLILPRNCVFIFNIVLTIFNLLLALYLWHYVPALPPETSFYPVHRLTHGDIARLRRPSQFINLEKMYVTMQPQPRTLKNWPIFLAPIDPNEPNRAFGNDPKRHLTPVGFISPEDREFRVSGKVSTVVQFRTIDFMMEFCQLVIRPPPDTAVGMSNLEVYELRQQLPITAKDLTFANRPIRHGSSLASIRVSNGSEWRHSFDCPQDVLFTFEFSCEGSLACDISWWQNKEPRDTGIFMIQSSTQMQ